MSNPLAGDLEHVLHLTRPLWDTMRGERVFITGGTGFFGCWLLETFTWANDRLGLGAEAHVLTRDPAAFLAKAPHLAGHAAVRLHAGDIRDFRFPDGSFAGVVHAATEASVSLNRDAPLKMLETVVDGTRRALEMARERGVERFLLTSSGAVYGRQPPEVTHVPEEYAGAPDPTDARSAYGEGKRMAELLCRLYAHEHGVQASIARCFAFVGPYLPLDTHFAAGNFVRDRLRGGGIVVQGDGTPRRSYLYAADLTACLWTILFRGPAGRAFNVGSEEDVSIEELARVAAGAGGGEPSAVEVVGRANLERLPERYVPATRRIAAELGMEPTVPLREGLERTLRWHREGRV